MHMKKTEDAINTMKKVLALIDENNLEVDCHQMYFIYNTIGYCYNERKDYESMIKYWELAKENLLKMEENENKKNLGHLLNNIGMAYFACNNLQKAQESFEESV